MKSLNQSLDEVKSLISQTMKIDETSDDSIETKFDLYQKYLESIKNIFVILDEDIKTLSSENKLNAMKNVQLNHASILKTTEHCLWRMRAQLSDEIENKFQPRSLNSLDKVCIKKNRSASQTSPFSSLDLLLAEKPANPIDSARFNIQKYVKATNNLLKSNKLSPNQKMSIQLQISREIEEKMSIARKHEDILCQINTDKLEILINNIAKVVSRHSIFRKNQDFPELYKQSQLFYYHILKDSRIYSLVKSKHSPEVSCLTFILKMNNAHPIVLFLNKLVNNLLNIPVSQENINAFIDELKIFNVTIENLAQICCFVINTDLSDNVTNISPKLHSVLIEFIYKNINFRNRIYHFLFMAYDNELKQYNENVKFVEENYNFEILLPDKFRSQSEVVTILDKHLSEFSCLRDVANPLEKLDKLCQIITDLMSKLQNHNSSIEIGADELVPILCYMIIKFNSAELFLHGKYLEHLVPESYLSGIEGYILVSIICAITYCVSENFSTHISKEN